MRCIWVGPVTAEAPNAATPAAATAGDAGVGTGAEPEPEAPPVVCVPPWGLTVVAGCEVGACAPPCNKAAIDKIAAAGAVGVGVAA